MLRYIFYKILRILGLVSQKKFSRSILKYRGGYKCLANSKLFDKKWYKSNYPDVKKDPLKHYLKKGWKEGRQPSPFFDGNKYLQAYHDVKAAGLNPLLHYECFGKYEGRTNFASKNALFVDNSSTIFDKLVRKNKFSEMDLDVFIITATKESSAVYIWRGHFIKEMFEKKGFSVAVESLQNISDDFINKLYNAKLIIFSRPVNNGVSAKIIKEIIKLNKKFIIDIDDLLLSDYAAYSGRYKSGDVLYENVLKINQLQSMCFDYASYVSVSTPFLAKEINKKFGLKIILMKNVISSSLCKAKEKNITTGLNVLYPSGTDTHLYDVSTVYIDLLNILYKYQDVTLTILGKSSLQDELRMFQNRVKIIPFCSFEDMLKVYSQYDLVIVPLDSNPFNNAKSNIKYIEAGAVGTPVLARDCDEFKAVIKDGINGFLYHDNFYEKFEQIYQQKDKLYQIGQNAFDDVIKNHTTNSDIPQIIKDFIC